MLGTIQSSHRSISTDSTYIDGYHIVTISSGIFHFKLPRFKHPRFAYRALHFISIVLSVLLIILFSYFFTDSIFMGSERETIRDLSTKKNALLLQVLLHVHMSLPIFEVPLQNGNILGIQFFLLAPGIFLQDLFLLSLQNKKKHHVH